MANWSKMAEAFGKALNRPRPIVGKTNEATERALNDYQNLVDKFESSAERTGHGDEFWHGMLRGEDINTEIENLNRGNELSDRVLRKQFDKISDSESDRALRDLSFDQAFDEAEKALRRTNPDDDAIKQNILEAIRQARENGIAESDILRQLKQLGRD